MATDSKKLLWCGVGGTIFCVLILAGAVGLRWQRTPEKAIRSEVPAKPAEDKPKDSGAIVPGADPETATSGPVVMPDGPTEDVVGDLGLDLSPRAQKALLLLKYPPPDDNITISDTDGPAVAAPRYVYQKGDNYRVRSFRIMTGPAIEKGMPDWIDQGELAVEVKEVDPQTQAATLLVRQTGPMNWVVGTVGMQDKGAEANLQEFQIVSYPDGRTELPKSLEYEGSVPMKVGMSGQGTGLLRFPAGKEVSVGETWKVASDDPANPGQEAQFTFEGYSLVGGVKCMRIRETSTGVRTIQVGVRDVNSAIRMKIATEGYHYFDMSRGLRWRADLVMKMQMESDNPQLAAVLGEKEVRSVRQVIK